jgi:hypothetical protein
MPLVAGGAFAMGFVCCDTDLDELAAVKRSLFVNRAQSYSPCLATINRCRGIAFSAHRQQDAKITAETLKTCEFRDCLEATKPLLGTIHSRYMISS